MSKKIAYLLIFTLCAIAPRFMASAAEPKAPDFAYPKRVAEQSLKELNAALKRGDSQRVIRSLIDYGLAETAIDPANASTVAKRVGEIASAETSPVTRSLLLTLQAEIYYQVYTASRYTYDERQLPLSPLPANLNEWSGDQFKAEISRLLSDAMSAHDDLAKAPVADYSGIIIADPLTRQYYPTLCDFTAAKTCSILQSIYRLDYSVNDRWMAPAETFLDMNAASLPAPMAQIISAYQTAIRSNRDRVGAFTQWDLNRLAWVKRHSDSTLMTQRLNELLIRLRGSEYQGLPLARLCQSVNDFDAEEQRALIAEANTYVKAYPDFYTTPTILNTINQLMASSVTLSVAPITPPKHPTPVYIRLSNIKSTTIEVYLLPKTRSRMVQFSDLTGGAKIMSIPVNVTSDAVAPFATDTVINIELPRYGEYAVVPRIPGVTPRAISTIVASDITLGNITGTRLNEVFATHPVTGRPIENVELTTQRGYNSGKTPVGKTNKNGIKDFSGQDQWLTVWGTKGADTFTPPISVNGTYESRADTRAEVLTSLPIYHPGDEIDAVVVIYRRDRMSNECAPGYRATVTLKSPTYEDVATTSVITDQWGRAEVQFDIPQVGLTGQYTIEITDSHGYIGAGKVMVSDYKMPTMEVSVDNPTVIPGEPVTIKGSVMTYSGFPIADAHVSLTLRNAAPMLWWQSAVTSTPFYAAEATSGADGSFIITLAQEVMDNAPRPDALFVCDITATTPNGESQSASTSFVNRKAYIINASFPSHINAASAVDISVKLTGNDGDNLDTPIMMTLTPKGGNPMATSPAFTTTLGAEGKVNLSKLPSGQYTLSLTPADTALTVAPYDRDVVLYRVNDSHSPVDELLWCPETTVSVNANRRATLYFEVAEPDTYIYCVTVGRKGALSQEWMETHPGMNAITVRMPEDESNLSVSIFTTHNLRSANVTINVNNDNFCPQLKLEAATFRDKVTPGSLETLTLRLTSRSGEPAAGAVMLDMWNDALSAIAKHKFRFAVSPLITPTSSVSNESNIYAWIHNSVESSPKWITERQLDAPMFQLYDQSFGHAPIMRRYMAMTRGISAKQSAATDDGMVVQLNSAPVMMASNDMEDEAMAPESAAGVAESDSGDTPDSTPSEYRDAATPLALFRPMLTTGEDGTLTLSYTVPNANAKWALSAIAYDQRMLTSSINLTQVASKQVMVQPNPPRFLRMGDKAVITALVMNNSDMAKSVTTHFEIFDPATGQTLTSTDSTESLAPKSSATVSVTVDTPFDTVMLGYRVKSSTDTHCDGEQGLIPVLESITPVIESDNFYMAPDSSTVTLPIPPAKPGEKVTLQFCQNPTWYVVTALPGLRAGTTNTANSAAAAIFSAAVADGIMASRPEVKNAIHRWLNSERSDSMLVSMLEQNQDLKIALLQATPWMLDARSDTERMERLALLFDKKEIARAYATNIQALSKMQCSGGGWSWTPDYKETSFWVTLNVLEGIGRLSKLGYLPSDSKLNAMIHNAVQYIDRHAAELYRKYPDSDFTHYVAVRDLFPSIKQSTAAAKVSEVTVKHIIDNWKSYDVTAKGIAAVILHNHGYDATARQILKSLREYATVTPRKGMWWPSLNANTWSRYSKLASAGILLDAFATIEPHAPEVDQIRQWIVLQKESQDWKDGVVTSSLIAAMLNSGTSWTIPPRSMAIRVNGEEFIPSAVTALSGYFREDITCLLGTTDGSVVIAKRGRYPSWGAVITREPMRMGEVKEAPCDGLSIAKNLYVVRGTSIESIDNSTTPLKVGDRIRVDLLIHAQKDMDYVALIDQRAACLEPVDQIPAPIWSQGICFYRENRDAATNIYIDRLPAGTYRLSYDLYVNNAGEYASGIATIQSQYAPALVAHSAGQILTVKR